MTVDGLFWITLSIVLGIYAIWRQEERRQRRERDAIRKILSVHGASAHSGGD